MIDSLLDFLKKFVDFLGGLNILDFIFLGLFLIIFIWMLVTQKRVKRVISDPLKKYDKDIKKKQDELDREKDAVRSFVKKEIKKMEEVHAEQRAQIEKEIEGLKEVKIEKEAGLKVEAELMAEAELRAEVESKAEEKEEAQVEKVVEVEKPAQVKQVAQEAVKEEQVEKEIPPEEEVKGEPALEPEPKAPIEKEIPAEKETPKEKEPEEEPKKAPEKPAKKEKPSKLTSEQYFILSAIADEPDKTYQEDAMYKIFKMAYTEREKEDFDQDVKKLEKLNYIVLEKPSGYRVWLKITDKGLAHYRDTEGK